MTALCVALNNQPFIIKKSASYEALFFFETILLISRFFHAHRGIQLID